MTANRAFIHIGLHKTGTKSIQFALAQRRSRLARGNWLYPREGTTSNRSGHHGLAWYLQGASHRHPGLLKFDLAAFQAEIASAGTRDIIVSSEELSKLSRNKFSIETVLGLFPAHEVFVVVYVREQAEFLNSLYTEVLKDMTYPSSIGNFVARRLQADQDNYLALLQLWHQRLGRRLLVRPYDRTEMYGGDTVRDFAHLMSIDDIVRPLPAERKNLQHNTWQVAVLIGLSRLLKKRDERWDHHSDRHRYLRRAVDDILQDPELRAGEPYWGLGPGVVRRVREHYESSNTALFRSVLGRDFEFSQCRIHRKRRSVKYEELPDALRKRLEERLMAGLADDQHR